MATETTPANARKAATENPISQRLWIGLGGIAAVLAVVALADMVQQRASNEAPIDGSSTDLTGEQAARTPAEPAPAVTEPLVDLGVVPDLPAEDTPAETPPMTAVPPQTPPVPAQPKQNDK